MDFFVTSDIKQYLEDLAERRKEEQGEKFIRFDLQKQVASLAGVPYGKVGEIPADDLQKYEKQALKEATKLVERTGKELRIEYTENGEPTTFSIKPGDLCSDRENAAGGSGGVNFFVTTSDGKSHQIKPENAGKVIAGMDVSQAEVEPYKTTLKDELQEQMGLTLKEFNALSAEDQETVYDGIVENLVQKAQNENRIIEITGQNGVVEKIVPEALDSKEANAVRDGDTRANFYINNKQVTKDSFTKKLAKESRQLATKAISKVSSKLKEAVQDAVKDFGR